MIIDFTIHGQNQFPVRGKQRLTARFRVHDAQPFVRQHGAPAAPDTAPIRTAMTDPAAHLQGLLTHRVSLLLHIENTDYSTHKLTVYS